MRILSATTDETVIYAMLAAKIKGGDMEYDKFHGEESWHCFQKDFINEEVNLISSNTALYKLMRICR